MKKLFLYKIFVSLFVLITSFSCVGTFAADNSVNFSDIQTEALKEFFSQVHFTFGGNNFPGGFLWTPTTNQTMKIKFAGNSEFRNCRRQLAGFYYNASRGNRLRPLDGESLRTLKENNPDAYNGLEMEGGFYTSCDSDAYGRYGQIKYTYKGVVSYLIIGTKVDFNNGIYKPEFAYSFTNFENKTPIGYLYDTFGGVGFVGGQLSSQCHEKVITKLNDGKTTIDEILEKQGDKLTVKDNPNCSIDSNYTGGSLETMRGISVAGNTSLSKALDEYDRRGIKGNLQNVSLVQTTNITIGKITQTLRKKGKNLCRGKNNQATDGFTVTPDFNGNDVVCVLFDKYDTKNIVNLNLANNLNYNGKTLVVENGDVLIQGKNPLDKYVDLFVDKGNLLIENIGGTKGSSEAGFHDFNEKGYPTTDTRSNSTKGVLLQGNFMVNGLLLGYNSTDKTVIPFNNKLFLHGKLATLNTPTEPQKGRLQQVEKIKASKIYSGYINLQNTFVWKCNPMTKKGTDGTDCGVGTGTKFMIPLYLVDHKYYSRLLE